VSLLSYYWSAILRGARHRWLMGAVLSLLYGYLYLLLRLEDYALLAGSVGLFAMLALVRFLTRAVNWYDLRFGPERSSVGVGREKAKGKRHKRCSVFQPYGPESVV
jgi:inner membrane protein involved in colicin E2 resistance